MFEVLESASVAKCGDERGNHDALVINDNYVAVFDALQARGWRAWDKLPAGVFARTVMVSTLESLPGDMDAKGVIRALQEALQERTQRCIEEMEDDQIYAYPQSRALIYSIAKREIWRLGDSPFCIDGKLNYQRSEGYEKAAEKRAEVLELFLANPLSDMKDLINTDYGRSSAMDIIIEEEQRVDGVQTLSGRPDVDIDVLLDNVEVFAVEPGAELILASDGYPRILATLQESEQWLEDERARDPLFVRDYKALQGAKDEEAGYDDRSYVRFIAQ